MDNWKAVIEEDAKRGPGLKECPRLSESHVMPNFWEKMNVSMAFQVFCNNLILWQYFLNTKYFFTKIKSCFLLVSVLEWLGSCRYAVLQGSRGEKA